jgi:hypothetical protein
MMTLKDVKRRAVELGALVLDDKIGDTHECTVEAPPGFCWEEGLHMFVDCANRPWKPDYDDLLNRMKDGVQPCVDAECEWCHPEE